MTNAVANNDLTAWEFHEGVLVDKNAERGEVVQGTLAAMCEAWEPHDTASLPKRLKLSEITTVPDLYQARGNERGTKYGDINEENARTLAGKLHEDPAKDLTPVTILYLPKANKRPYVLNQGHHRLCAYALARRTDIPVVYLTVDPFEAISKANEQNLETRTEFTSDDAMRNVYVKLVRPVVHPVTGKRWTLEGIAKDTGAHISSVKRLSTKVNTYRKENPGAPMPETFGEFNSQGREPDQAWHSAVTAKWAAKIKEALPRVRSQREYHRAMEALMVAYPQGFDLFLAAFEERTQGKMAEYAAAHFNDNLGPAIKMAFKATLEGESGFYARMREHGEAWEMQRDWKQDGENTHSPAGLWGADHEAWERPGAYEWRETYESPCETQWTDDRAFHELIEGLERVCMRDKVARSGDDF